MNILSRSQALIRQTLVGVERASITRDLLLGVWFVVLILAPAFGRYALTVALLGIAGLCWSAIRRARRRRVAREQLDNWAATPLRRDAPYVIQETLDGERTGVIDTREHYSVEWEYFDPERAVYSVRQGDQSVFVSTLASNAADILVSALQVRNYPCVEWPNWDI